MKKLACETPLVARGGQPPIPVPTSLRRNLDNYVILRCERAAITSHHSRGEARQKIGLQCSFHKVLAAEALAVICITTPSGSRGDIAGRARALSRNLGPKSRARRAQLLARRPPARRPCDRQLRRFFPSKQTAPFALSSPQCKLPPAKAKINLPRSCIEKAALVLSVLSH